MLVFERLHKKHHILKYPLYIAQLTLLIRLDSTWCNSLTVCWIPPFPLHPEPEQICWLVHLELKWAHTLLLHMISLTEHNTRSLILKATQWGSSACWCSVFQAADTILFGTVYMMWSISNATWLIRERLLLPRICWPIESLNRLHKSFLVKQQHDWINWTQRV